MMGQLYGLRERKEFLAPYSYRYKRLAVGRRKMLMVYDMEATHIKGFALRNVKKVAISDRKFKPKWSIEIAVLFLIPFLGLL